jgi:hypothetical protein
MKLVPVLTPMIGACKRVNDVLPAERRLLRQTCSATGLPDSVCPDRLLKIHVQGRLVIVLGRTLLEVRTKDLDYYDAVESVFGWGELATSIDETEKLAARHCQLKVIVDGDWDCGD